MEPILGQIMLFGFNFAPRGWALCQGQLLSIEQNQSLFSLLGTTYGGNGITTFALPDLRGRAPIGFGTGPGLTNKNLGSTGGAETVTLNTSQMPSHNHTASAGGNVLLSGTPGVRDTPNAGDLPAAPGFSEGLGVTKVNAYGPATDTVNGQALPAPTIGNQGGNLSHNNMSPYIGMNYCIALQGVFPSR